MLDQCGAQYHRDERTMIDVSVAVTNSKILPTQSTFASVSFIQKMTRNNSIRLFFCWWMLFPCLFRAIASSHFPVLLAEPCGTVNCSAGHLVSSPSSSRTRRSLLSVKTVARRLAHTLFRNLMYGDSTPNFASAFHNYLCLIVSNAFAKSTGFHPHLNTPLATSLLQQPAR